MSRNLGDPSKLVLFLSGGVDSRTILGSALKAVNGDGTQINAVTWGCDPDKVASDVAVAREIAAEFALNYHFIERERDQYAERFRRLNFLLDGLSVMAAEHPHELEIMEYLHAMGYRRVLRGDQMLGGPRRSVYNAKDVLAMVGLYRFRQSALLPQMITPDVYPVMAEASDEHTGELRRAYRPEPVSRHKLLLRFIVFKNWYDTFT